MTTQIDASNAIAKRLISSWGATTPIATENDNFDTEGQDAPWIKLSVNPISSQQHTLGSKSNRKFERIGIINIQVFVEAGTNIETCTLLSQQALAIFEGEEFDSVVCQVGLIQTIGREEKWFQMNVSIDYNFIETK